MKGFTLIELLVVVIIIGILAAIALPQYELVVEKSRASEAMINAKAILDACQRHLQEFPEDNCDNKSKIADVQLKGGTWNTEETCFATKKFAYTLGLSGLEVARMDSPSCANTAGMLYAVTYYLDKDHSGVKDKDCDEDYEQVCKLFTDL